MAATTLFAMDVRLVTGNLVSSKEKTSLLTGMEAAFLSSPRSNGLVYSLKVSGMLDDFKAQEGGMVAMDLEFIYRMKHKTEIYLLAGGVFRSVNAYDNAFGWESGMGVRYVWCGGFELGVQGKGMQLTYQSNQSDTNFRDGDLDTAVLFNVYGGWRF